MRTRRIFGAAALAVAGSLAASAVAPTPAPAQGGVSLGFGEGSWVGTMSYLGTTELGGVPVLYRGAGGFELDSDGSTTDGSWLFELVALPDGAAPANATGIGPLTGETLHVVVELDRVVASEVQTGMELEFTAEELDVTDVGALLPESSGCHAISGTWSIPYPGANLEGSFIANRTLPGDAGGAPAFQDLHLEGVRILEMAAGGGDLDLDVIRAYLVKAELAMNHTWAPSDECDEDTIRRFNTAAIALADAMLGAVASRIDELSDTELVEMIRLGYRTGAFVHYELGRPFLVNLQQRMADAANGSDVEAMRYWLPIAQEFDYVAIAENLDEAIERETR